MPKILYRQIRKAGFLLFIPFILAAGPLTGYFVGAYLVEEKHWPFWVFFICIAFGFAAAIREIIRILRLIAKDNGKDE